MVKERLIATLALCATFFALGVVALGAYTRLMDAGLGCPDWPGCYGHLIVSNIKQTLSQYADTPFVRHKAWAEMIHRYFVGGLSLFLLSIIFIIFIAKRTCSNILLAMGLILLLIYQILLGQWTVTYKLMPIVVTQHLLGGFLILVLVWLIYLNNRKSAIVIYEKKAKILFPSAIFGLMLLFMQIALGAWTSTNYASLSCPDFPFCLNNHPGLPLHLKEAYTILSPIGVNYEGGVLSEIVRQTIQMMHRLGALIVSGYMIIFTVVAILYVRVSLTLMKSLYCILALLIIQICLGIVNVMFGLPVSTAILHNIAAAVLLLSMVTFLFKLRLVTRERK